MISPAVQPCVINVLGLGEHQNVPIYIIPFASERVSGAIGANVYRVPCDLVIRSSLGGELNSELLAVSSPTRIHGHAHAQRSLVHPAYS
jgi:hypothetical protein